MEREFAPLKRRIDKLLTGQGGVERELARRVRVLRAAARQPDARVFQALADATAWRRCVDVRYLGRERDAETARVVSPQRLVHYRDNWYLDAWCHQREALRSFAVDRVRHVRVLDQPAPAHRRAALHRRARPLGGGGTLACRPARPLAGRRPL